MDKNPKQTIKDADKKVYEAESIRLKAINQRNY